MKKHLNKVRPINISQRFAQAPVDRVGFHAIFAGILLSITQTYGWTEWGHNAAGAVMTGSIVLWMVCRWWWTSAN